MSIHNSISVLVKALRKMFSPDFVSYMMAFVLLCISQSVVADTFYAKRTPCTAPTRNGERVGLMSFGYIIDNGNAMLFNYSNRGTGYLIAANAVSARFSESSESSSPYFVTGHVEVPSSLGGYPVVKVGECAFKDCTQISSIKIPEGVIDIAAYAFENCEKLNKLECSTTVTNIDWLAFKGTTNLETVVLWGNTKPSNPPYQRLSIKNLTTPAFQVSQLWGTPTVTNLVFNDKGEKVITETLFSSCDRVKCLTLLGNFDSVATNTFVETLPALEEVRATKSTRKAVQTAVLASGRDIIVNLINDAGEVIYDDPPVISPETGTIISGASLSVTITCPREDAVIHYTTNGTIPTADSPVYKKFRIYGKSTINAIAIYDTGIASDVVTANYAFGKSTSPVITPTAGSTFQHSGQEVSIDWNENDGTLYYTIDDSEPTTNSLVYAGPFMIDETTTIKTKVFSDKFFDSAVVTANLTREWEAVETPVITAGETFMGSREVVTITCGTDGAAIRYTLDGTEPTKDSPLYRGAFNVKESCTIKAIAFLEDYLDSEIVSVSVTRVRGVGDVLGVLDVAFADGGALAWTEDANTAGALGGNSMKSGKITHLQESTLTATVTGKGTLSFYVKTSCEDSEGYYDWDRLEFTADGEMLPFDGERGWTNIVKTFTTDGPHTLTWTYIKDNAGSEGGDCAWLSNVSWTRTDLDPLPEIGAGGSPAEVEDALDGVVDTRLKSRIVVGSDYVRFRNWSNKVGGDNFAHHQAVKDSPHAWLSYALDSAVLLTKAPAQGEMKVAAFERNAATGKFDFSVAIDGVSVGENATAENLATLLGVEGSASVDGEYRADNVTFEFGTPVGGKVTISAEQNDKAATKLFLKVKMTP